MLQTLTGGGESLGISGAIFVVSAVVVWLAGTRLAGYANRFAEAAGLGGAVVGLVLLGAITSLPELATVATSAAGGAGALAVNNLIGSVSMQLLLLALVDVMIGKDALTARPPRPDVLAYAAMVCVLTALTAAAIAAGDRELLGTGVGLGPVVVFAGYLGCLAAARAIDAGPRWRPSGDGEKAANGTEDRERSGESAVKLLGPIATTGLAILIAGFFLSRSGEALAEQTGLGQSFFGLVVLAAATSLPEFSSAVGAVRLDRPQLAIGDILGANLFNLSMLLLVDVLYRDGPVMSEAGPFEIVAALLGTVLAGVFLIGLVERRDKTVLRMGWDSATVLLVYAGGLVVLFGLRETAAS
jgi:cation:H+ antiporter